MVAKKSEPVPVLTWRNETRRLSELVPWDRNPRQIRDAEARRLGESLLQFGQVQTIAIGPDNSILDGHQRALVWSLLQEGGDREVDVRVSSRPLTEKEREKLVVYLHRGATGEWDFSALANGFDFDELVEWGFSESELVGFDFGNSEPAGEDPGADLDKAAELQAKWNVQSGDLWIMKDHRLICGDCTDPTVVARVMGGEKASLVHADPPYGMGKEKDGIANDNLYREKLDAFQMAWWKTCRPLVEDNASAYIWGNAEDLWRLWYRGGLADSERLTFRNEIVWAKGSAGAGGISHQGSEGLRLFPQSTERCLFFMLGEQGFNNNADNYWEGWEGIRSALAADCEKMGWGAKDIERICGVGMYGHWFTKSQWIFIPEQHYKKLQAAAREHDAFKREHDDLKREHDDLKREFYATRAYFDNTHDNMTDVWSFNRVTGDDRHGHATPKPVEMMERVIKSSTTEDAVVYVPFNGSGPELIACERLNRRCRAIEIEPKYTAVALQRFFDMTGVQPVLEKAS